MNSIGEAPGHSPKHLYMINAVDGWSKRFDAVVLTPTWEANSTRHSSGRGCRHPSCGWKRLSVAPTIHQARSQIFLRLYFPASVVSTLERHGVAQSADIDAATLPDRMSAEIRSSTTEACGPQEVMERAMGIEPIGAALPRL